MKRKFTTPWTPYSGGITKHAYRGDEYRKFQLSDGRAGVLSVDYTAGGWNWTVYVGEVLIAKNRSWGERTKSNAMAMAAERLREWVSSGGTMRFQLY
ncbi:MAG: hypothetical protein ACWGQW_01920 [bacterium]